MRRNPLYIRYYITMTRLLFLGIFPFSLLVFFNYRIVCQMQVPSIIEALPAIERSTRKTQEKDLAKVLIGIVVIFILCHTLRVLTDFYEMIIIDNIMLCNKAGKVGVSSWLIQLNYFSKLMIATNSSISMVIYCLINSTFRQKLFIWKGRRSVQSRPTDEIMAGQINMRKLKVNDERK